MRKTTFFKSLLVAFMLMGGVICTWADTTVVGPTDNSNDGYYNGYSKQYSVANNKKISIEFTVSTATDEQLSEATWYPWYAWAVNFWDGTLNAITVEARDYGWEAGTENNRWTTNWAKYWAQNYPTGWADGTAFRDIIQGATVVATVERINTYVIISYDITTTGGDKYRQFVVKEYGDGTTIWFDLIVNHAHITIDNEKTSTTDVPVAGRLIGNYNRCITFTDTENAARKNFTLAPNGSLNFKFKNYSAGVATWQSWMFEMLYNGKYCNMVAGNNDQWGALRNGEGTFNNTNWPSDILSKMEGATVDMTITRSGASVTVTAVHTPVTGEDFTLEYTFSSAEENFATSDAEVHLISDYGYLDLLPYEVNVSANNVAYGTASAETAYVGEDVTVTATPNSGYRFVNWTENEVEVSTNASYTYTAYTDRTLVANFEVAPSYTYSVTDNLGNTLASGNAYEGTDVIFYVPYYAFADGRFYTTPSLSSGSLSYGKGTISSIAANTEITVSYTEETNTNVVFFSEAENLTSISEVNDGYTNIRMSNGKAGYYAAQTAFVNLPAGTYTLTAATRTGTTTFYKGTVGEGTELMTLSSSGSVETKTSDPFTLTENTDIYTSVGSSSNYFDYVIIRQTAVSSTVSTAGFATYVNNSYDLDFSETAIEAYKVKVSEKGVAKLTKVNAVPAGTPVLLYKEGGTTENIPITTGAAAVSDNDLVAGTGAAVATTDGEYTNMILNNVDSKIGFYYANDKTVATDKAYLHILTKLAPATADAPMRMVFDKDAMGISDINGTVEKATGFYNLSGQRVANPAKGLYIVNGKKVFIK